MIPTYDPKHATEILALLTDAFKNASNIRNMLSAVAVSTQQLEDALLHPSTGYIFLIQLANASGDTLDKYGAIVLLPRNGLNDANYRVALMIRLRVLRSSGRSEDIIQVASLAGTLSTYLEFEPAAFLVEMWNLVAPFSPLLIAEFLKETRPGGVYGMLHYTTWAPGNDFEYVSRYGGAVGEGTWGSRYDGTIGGLLVAGAQI